MRNYLLLILVSTCFSPIFSNAQCSTCYSLEEAVKKPGEVTSLSLRDQGLASIPEEIALFYNLETLDLSYNQLVDLSKVIPANPKLKTLKTSNNYGLDVAGLMTYCAKLESLSSLEASGCGIHFIPETISELKLLKNLDLSGNNLKILPSAMEKLVELETLDLSYNNLREIIYVGSSFWNLKKIDVSNNDKMNLSSLFTGISFLGKLEELVISDDERETSFPKEIGLLTVPKIVIRNTQIKKLNPAFMKNKELRELVFENCDIYNEEQVVNLLKNMRKLESMEFFYTDCFAKISELKQLNELSISQNGKLPLSQLGKMNQLQTLDLRLQKMEEAEKEQLKSELPKTTILFTLRDFEQSMASNNVTPIVKLKPSVKNISATESSTLVFEKMKLDVPANAFLNPNGSPYKGTVNVQVTEMFDPVSMALSGAPMVYGTGNDAQLFGSNGMFEFRAKDQAGNDLQPNPAAIIQVSIQNVQPNVPGQLFAFDSVANQWQITGTPRAFNTDSLVKIFIDSINLVDDLKLVSYIDIPIIVKVKMKRKRNEPSLLNFTFEKNKSMRKEGKDEFYRKLYLPNHAQRQITKHEWKIDSLVSDQTQMLFREIAHKQKKMDKKRRRNKLVYDNYPRYVKEMKIAPDFEKDHFVMSFRYKDSIVKIPVYLNNGGKTKSLIEQQNNFFSRYHEKLKSDDKFYSKIQRKRSKKLKKYADSRRNTLITSYRNRISMPNMIGSEQLRFGLTRFGPVNCDYFDREIPDDYFALKNELHDESGNEIKVPHNIRILLFNTNSYLQTSKNRVPFYVNSVSLILFEYEKEKLAVVEIDGEGYERVFKTRTMNISGVDPSVVQKFVLGM